MKVRLTQNLDKDRGFVNGATGTIHQMLGDNVFIVKTEAGVLLLVHSIWQKGHCFLPVTYAYATTIRRAQGATLQLVGSRFDRRLADEGYTYLAVSRARHRVDVFLVGSIRRTDWRPVGGDERGAEHQQGSLSVMSLSDSEEPESEDPESEDRSMNDLSQEAPESEEMNQEETSEESGFESPVSPEDRSEEAENDGGEDRAHL